MIRDGILADPARSTVFRGHIGLRDGKIAAVTPNEIFGRRVIDAGGRIVAPGFIDIHGHIDGHLECALLSLVQGVTTTVGGNCGIGPLHLASFFESQAQKGFPIHQAQLVGHSLSLREAVGLADPYRAAGPAQIARMAELADQALAEGAIGLSFGLEYAPGSSWEEVAALGRVAADRGRLVPIHTRVLTRGDLASLQEAIDISATTGAAVLVSHFVYQYGGGFMTAALDMVDAARRRGLPVAVDSGMYTAFATFIGAPLFSPAAMAEFGWKPEDLLAATGKYRGRRLDQGMYQELRRSNQRETVICFTGNETEIREPLLKEYAMLSSDTGPSGDTAAGHPQSTGSFPRFFRKMVREQKALPLLAALAKCTILPARTLGLANKGRLAEGGDADLVIFDIDRIRDRADFPGVGRPDTQPDTQPDTRSDARPDTHPEGIDYVIVGGEVAVAEGQIVPGVLAGKPIRAGRA